MVHFTNMASRYYGHLSLIFANTRLFKLYSGGYGADFTNSILPYLNITTGTSFYINPTALATFGLHVLSGQQVLQLITAEELTRNNSG